MSGGDGSEEAVASAPDDELSRLKAENEALRTSLDRRAFWRKVLTVILVILTSVSVVVSTLAVWAHQVVFDTDRFMETVSPIVDDPRFYALVGDRASDAALEALDIENRLTEQLTAIDEYLSDALLDALDVSDRARDLLGRVNRPSLADLAPGIANALETRIDTRIHEFFASDAFVSRFPGLVARVHQAAVALARDDMAQLPNVYIADGEVRLNLIPYLAEALRTVAEDIRAALPDFDLPDVVSDQLEQGRDQLATALQANLPDDFAQLTVMSEDRLGEIQSLASSLDRYVWASVIVSLLLLVVTLLVSKNRRVTTLQLGIGIFAAVAIAAVIIRRVQTAVVSQVLDPDSSALAGEMVDGVLSGLRTIQLLLAVGAILVAVVAYLAGRPAWFANLTEKARVATEPAPGGSVVDRWVTAHAGPLRVGGVLLAVAVLFLTGLDLLTVVIIGLLLGGFLWLVAGSEKRVNGEDGSAPMEEVTVSGDSGDV